MSPQDRTALEEKSSELLSFLTGSIPPVISVLKYDEQAAERGSPGLPFFALALLIHGLAHATNKRYHGGNPVSTRCDVKEFYDLGYQLETEFFGGIIGIVFKNGTVKDQQLPEISYFTLLSPEKKIYKIDMFCAELTPYRLTQIYADMDDAATWDSRADGKLAPFDFDRLEDLSMTVLDFFAQTCTAVNTSYAPVNIRPHRRRPRLVKIGNLYIFPTQGCMCR
ncbi:uncharacterized protein BT62DRAFT_1012054 [Guyanagaster necrorhizus]|uniref:Uncharacterized protein n=1 Tax=Guyanagaster necrorhizus TaxID=856835 RepID=A0A9P8AM88_9AGAR|nr:uncharacterized protein BT62DRAFT_1012054 [Guyanagaster necrorhizus MCA 3950]KAG7441018.1 hypothetical protein BT62DRAFT_1012054 [Guyanagaster necrorhizus MCA 3950]